MVFHIADDHFAETFRIFVLRTTQKNDFIAQNGSGILLDIVFRDVVGRIGLEARDKIHTGEIPFIQHGKIDVSAITNHHAVTREFHSSGAVYLMNISIGEINEHGKMTIMIQQHIELDCPFGLPIGCPWKNFNAKLNQRCVETVKFLGKRKLMPGAIAWQWPGSIWKISPNIFGERWALAYDKLDLVGADSTPR